MSDLPIYRNKTHGAVAHSLCIAYLCSVGYVVSFPIFDNARYDLIFDDGSCLKRVQCKSSKLYSTGKNYYKVSLENSSVQKRYNIDQFDYLWTTTNDKAYFIPVNSLPHDDSGNLGSGILLTPKYTPFIVSMPLSGSGEPAQRVQQPPVTEVEKSRISSLYNSGMSQEEISLIMGIGMSSVSKVLVEKPIENGSDPKISAQILEMYKSGTSVFFISKEFSIPTQSIKKILKAYGLPVKREKLPDDLSEIVVDLYFNKDISISEISSITKASKGEVSAFLKKYRESNNLPYPKHVKNIKSLL